PPRRPSSPTRRSSDLELTGRGHPFRRGAITGSATFIGGVLHTLPFLSPNYGVALAVAMAVVGVELLAIAWIRNHFFGTPLGRSRSEEHTSELQSPYDL